MIDDSIPWKDDLLKVADRLEAKTKQKRWTERTGYLIERDFMLSAFARRRLLDAHKVSDALRHRQIPVTRFDLVGDPPDLMSPADIGDSYDFANGRRITLTIVKLCQQFIHSFVFTFSCDESTDLLGGVYVASDFDRGKFLYRVAASDNIALCRDIGAEDMYSKTWTRDETARCASSRCWASRIPRCCGTRGSSDAVGNVRWSWPGVHLPTVTSARADWSSGKRPPPVVHRRRHRRTMA